MAKLGQERLKASKVVVVGAGGLGSPCALYLASAGVGTIGIVDYDSVDESNLQRQVIHTEASAAAGRSKVDSACDAIARLNHFVRCVPHHVLLGSTTALQVLGAYDIVVDATDNAATRYLLNDACVMLGKPLVSGSALRMEGQLTVYNYAGGPCYRCLFPTPPPAASVTNCADGGVLGPVTGVIGTMQAMEVLKIAMGQQPAYAQKMLLYDATDGSFRQLKLRPRNENCIAPTLKELIDYELFCGSGALDKTPAVHLLAPHEEIEPKLLAPIIHDRFLLDVRNTTQFGICALPDSKSMSTRRKIYIYLYLYLLLDGRYSAGCARQAGRNGPQGRLWATDRRRVPPRKRLARGCAGAPIVGRLPTVYRQPCRGARPMV